MGQSIQRSIPPPIVPKSKEQPNFDKAVQHIYKLSFQQNTRRLSEYDPSIPSANKSGNHKYESHSEEKSSYSICSKTEKMTYDNMNKSVDGKTQELEEILHSSAKRDRVSDRAIIHKEADTAKVSVVVERNADEDYKKPEEEVPLKKDMQSLNRVSDRKVSPNRDGEVNKHLSVPWSKQCTAIDLPTKLQSIKKQADILQQHSKPPAKGIHLKTQALPAILRQLIATYILIKQSHLNTGFIESAGHQLLLTQHCSTVTFPQWILVASTIFSGKHYNHVKTELFQIKWAVLMHTILWKTELLTVMLSLIAKKVRNEQYRFQHSSKKNVLSSKVQNSKQNLRKKRSQQTCHSEIAWIDEKNTPSKLQAHSGPHASLQPVAISDHLQQTTNTVEFPEKANEILWAKTTICSPKELTGIQLIDKMTVKTEGTAGDAKYEQKQPNTDNQQCQNVCLVDNTRASQDASQFYVTKSIHVCYAPPTLIPITQEVLPNTSHILHSSHNLSNSPTGQMIHVLNGKGSYSKIDEITACLCLQKEIIYINKSQAKIAQINSYNESCQGTLGEITFASCRNLTSNSAKAAFPLHQVVPLWITKTQYNFYLQQHQQPEAITVGWSSYPINSSLGEYNNTFSIMSTTMSNSKITLGSNRQAHSYQNEECCADFTYLKVLPIEPSHNPEGMLCYTCHSVIKRTKLVSTQDNEYREYVFECHLTCVMEIINAPLDLDFIDDLPLSATTADSVLQPAIMEMQSFSVPSSIDFLCRVQSSLILASTIIPGKCLVGGSCNADNSDISPLCDQICKHSTSIASIEFTFICKATTAISMVANISSTSNHCCIPGIQFCTIELRSYSGPHSSPWPPGHLQQTNTAAVPDEMEEVNAINDILRIKASSRELTKITRFPQVANAKVTIYREQASECNPHCLMKTISSLPTDFVDGLYLVAVRADPPLDTEVKTGKLPPQECPPNCPMNSPLELPPSVPANIPPPKTLKLRRKRTVPFQVDKQSPTEQPHQCVMICGRSQFQKSTTLKDYCHQKCGPPRNDSTVGQQNSIHRDIEIPLYCSKNSKVFKTTLASSDFTSTIKKLSRNKNYGRRCASNSTGGGAAGTNSSSGGRRNNGRTGRGHKPTNNDNKGNITDENHKDDDNDEDSNLPESTSIEEDITPHNHGLNAHHQQLPHVISSQHTVVDENKVYDCGGSCYFTATLAAAEHLNSPQQPLDYNYLAGNNTVINPVQEYQLLLPVQPIDNVRFVLVLY